MVVSRGTPAEIAADPRILTRRGQDVTNQSRGGRLAVGSGNGHDLGPLMVWRSIDRASEELDIAQHLDTGGLGLGDGPVGFRMGQGHAGGLHQGVKLAPISAIEVDHLKAFRKSSLARSRFLIPKGNRRPASQKGARSGQAGSAQTEDRNALAFKTFDGDHSRALPIAASRWLGR